MSQVVELVSKKPISPHSQHLVFELMVNDQNGDDVEVPYARLKYVSFVAPTCSWLIYQFTEFARDLARGNLISSQRIPIVYTTLNCMQTHITTQYMCLQRHARKKSVVGYMMDTEAVQVGCDLSLSLDALHETGASAQLALFR